jgi:hypothetical protein
MVDLAKGGEEGEPATKRTRLESIVPTAAPPPRKKARRLGSRLRRRSDPSRRRRRSGYLASSRRPSGGADPAPRTTTRGEVGRYAAMRAETTAEPTVGREGRSGAVSAAAGAAGDSAARSVYKTDPSLDL